MLLSCDSLASSEDNTEHSHLSNMSSRSTTSSSRDKAVFMDMNIMLGKRKVYYVTRSTIKQLRSDSSDNNDDHVDKKHCLSPSSSSSSTRGGHGNHPRSNTHKTTRNSTAKWDETEAKRIILEYSIDPYDYSHDELIDLSVEIFRYYDLINTFHFTANAASNFFQAVKDLYSNSNDFHNFRHAFGVMHMCFQILLHGGDSYLDSFDVLAVLVAAICHDVGHPGNNNAFELAIQSDVSKLYAHPDEICVLEKYHASETQSLLTIAQSQSNKRGQKGKDRDILCGISESEKERFFHQVRFIILGTDMAKHTALVDEAKDLIGQIISKQHDNPPMEETKSSFTRRNEPKYSPTVTGVGNLSTTYGDAETRLALTRIIVHTADIGAQTQAIPVAVKWAERVYKEFRSQADRERALGIMTSPFIHDLKDQSKMYTSQYSFINDIVEPIWNVVISLLPQLQFALEQLDVNKDHYKSFFPPETVISNNNNHHHNKSPQKHSTTSSNKNTKSHNNQHHNTNTHTSSRAAKTATA